MIKSILAKSSLVALLAASVCTPMLFKPKPAQALGFDDSCTSATYDAGRLVAFCTKIDGSETVTALRLSNKISNIDGILFWGKGGFDRTCGRIRIRTFNGITRLYATCLDAQGNPAPRDSLRLDERIENRDGRLIYITD